MSDGYANLWRRARALPIEVKDEVRQSRFDQLMEGVTVTRYLTVPLNQATERRLRRAIASYNAETPNDPMHPYENHDLTTMLLAVADGGLSRGEDDEGVWTTPDGIAHPLPRARRSPWTWRLKFAWRAAVRTWRST